MLQLVAITVPVESHRKVVLGWTAVCLSTITLVFWSYWGSIEAFYEGWYYRSFWMNLGLTVVQYLLPVLALMLGAVIVTAGGMLIVNVTALVAVIPAALVKTA